MAKTKKIAAAVREKSQPFMLEELELIAILPSTLALSASAAAARSAAAIVSLRAEGMLTKASYNSWPKESQISN